MTSDFQTLNINTEHPHIVIVTLNRPEVRNAINAVMMQELAQCWQQLSQQPSAIRCIILTGEGDKAFCAGADLKERLNLAIDTWKQQHLHLQQAMRTMIACPIPIIAAVNGPAYGGGLELALASDFIYAVDNATFAQSEVKLGIMPGAMGSQHLPRAAGMRRAKELCFTAQAFNAQQALNWGIVNKLCSPQQLLSETLKTAQQITANAPFAIRQVKQALNAADHLDLSAGYTFEVEHYNPLLESQDRIEGIRAFNEKRQPDFQDK